MSWVEGLEERFKAALEEQQQRTLLGILESELLSLTFGQLAELVQSPLGALIRDVKLQVLFRPSSAHPGRPPSAANPAQVQREAAMLKILQDAHEPLSQVQVGDRLGEHKGVYFGLRRLVDRGLVVEEGYPPLVRYSVAPGAQQRPPSPASVAATAATEPLERQILDLLSKAPKGLSPAALRSSLAVDISGALKSLNQRKAIKRRGVGRGTQYFLPDPKPLAPSPSEGVPRSDELSTKALADAIVKVLRAAEGPLSSAELRRALDCPSPKFNNALDRAQRTGHVDKVGTPSRPLYALMKR